MYLKKHEKNYAIISFFAQLICAQTPCSNGKAGIYPCKDYDLLSNVPVNILANTNGNPEGSDIWGWTDSTTGKEYAIAAMTNSTAFVDVTDPVNPIFLGRLDSNAGNNYWRDVKVYKDHAFIVADNVGAHGMQVFDLTKLRGLTSAQNFTADVIYNTDFLGSCHNIFINEDSGVAYLVGCKNFRGSRIFNGGPIFVDISDPKNPTKINHYANAGYSHDVQVVKYDGPDTEHKGKEIFIGSNETEVTILDVTDKNNVIKIAEIGYSQTVYTHQGWFTEDQRYFILGDEQDEQKIGMNSRTLVFDFEDLDNPKLSSTYFGPSAAIDHNGYVKGNLFYLANYNAGLRVLDITNISASTNSMTEVGYFDTHPENDATSFNGAWSVYPYFASGNLIINDIERGLFVIRKSGTLGLENQELNKSFSVFPNPASENTIIKSSNNQFVKSVQLYSLLGQKVREENNINSTEYVLNTKGLKKGIYLIKINNLRTSKLVIK
ncbi:choice-of-anchor B family protein [Polaribacter sp. MSW5]|uniref:Choice-of-anchor B family protein n=1 Tax=Polaribacter ponticola TaxID=2978475 RepID=A0ABT5SBV0_9FLAO|nr:choice-of-anchor B family protein [Polaribacter sp. MSW5]MDD7915599.1 choice-of-anchor B family protein [Polaribacter sp. MSW5]